MSEEDPKPQPPAPEPQPAPAPPKPDPKDRVYTEAELQQRLKGLEAQAKELGELKARQAEADRKAAEERGEFEKLYKEQAASAEALKAELEAKRSSLERYESLLADEVKGLVDGLPEELKPRAKKLMEGRSVLDQRELVSVLAAASGSQAPAPPKNGPPGRPRPGGTDEARFINDPHYQAQVLRERAKQHG